MPVCARLVALTQTVLVTPSCANGRWLNSWHMACNGVNCLDAVNAYQTVFWDVWDP